jgi:hypothetical protein
VTQGEAQRSITIIMEGHCEEHLKTHESIKQLLIIERNKMKEEKTTTEDNIIV